MIILITGGAGYIGKKLSPALRKQGHEVRILTRNPKNKPDHYYWDPTINMLDRTALDGVQAVIHLAGSGIASHRWTSRYKEEMISSRVDTALFLKEELATAGVRLKHVISTSGTAYYGDRNDEILPESATPGDDFLSQLCVQWENAGESLGELSEYTSILRLGILIAPDSMFIKKTKSLIKMYLAAPLGNGKQYVPWIHTSDVIRFIAAILEEKVSPGIYSLAAPEILNNTELLKRIASLMHRRIILPPVPEFVLSILYGEMKMALVESARLDLSKIEATGFKFEHPTLSAL